MRSRHASPAKLNLYDPVSPYMRSTRLEKDKRQKSSTWEGEKKIRYPSFPSSHSSCLFSSEIIAVVIWVPQSLILRFHSIVIISDSCFLCIYSWPLLIIARKKPLRRSFWSKFLILSNSRTLLYSSDCNPLTHYFTLWLSFLFLTTRLSMWNVLLILSKSFLVIRWQRSILVPYMFNYIIHSYLSSW